MAGWREGLLAQKVLAGGTRGYRAHPQLRRFQECGRPDEAIATYLGALADEADTRGYAFDRHKLLRPLEPDLRLEVTVGQLEYEWGHLLAKLAARSPDVLARWVDVRVPPPHPIFTVVPGPVADWEVVAPV